MVRIEPNMLPETHEAYGNPAWLSWMRLRWNEKCPEFYDSPTCRDAIHRV